MMSRICLKKKTPEKNYRCRGGRWNKNSKVESCKSGYRDSLHYFSLKIMHLFERQSDREAEPIEPRESETEPGMASQTRVRVRVRK